MNRSAWLLKMLRDHLHREPSTPGDGSAPPAYFNDTRNDQWIAEVVFPGRHQGFFLEAGAGNGRAASSCYALEKHLGWTGICVEPNSAFYHELVRNRPASACANLCLAGRTGPVEYIEGGPGSSDPYLGGIRRNLESIKHGGEDVVEHGRLVVKDAVTLDELLRRYEAPPIIDYAAFDIEGSEWETLAAFSFQHHLILALSLECDDLVAEPIGRLLSSHGYRQVSNPFNKYQPWERYWLHEEVQRRNTDPKSALPSGLV